MSFSTVLKEELCSFKTTPCCRRAECYAMLLFGQSFSAKKISLLSKTPAVIQNLSFLLKKSFGITADILCPKGSAVPNKAVLSKESCEELFNALNISPDNILNPVILQSECCSCAFLRGAFLACGQIQSPEKGARIDFRIKNKPLAGILGEVLDEIGIKYSLSERDTYTLLYIKKSESVEDTVTAMGASNVTLQLIDEKMIKELRNNINRRSNLEVSNLSRVVNSSLRQRAAIEKIIKSGKFEMLSPALQELALLRMANHEASLSDLCRLYSTSITRSSLNNMLSKLIEIGEKI